MYAKLVMKTTATSNGLFNNLIGVITGTISNTSSLDSNTFDTSLSTIINTVSPGWEVWDSQASTGAIGNVVPQVIRSAWSDSNNYHKYLWVGNMSGDTNAAAVTANVWLNWLPAEGWDTSTNTGNNILVTAYTTRNGNSNWYAVPGYTTNTTVPLTIIVSASQTHLLIYTANTTASPAYKGHIFLSEYTRDDAWNTVNNGYPAWYMEGQTSVNAATVFITNSNGTIPRIRTIAGTNTNHLAMMTTSGATSNRISHNGTNYLVVSKTAIPGNTNMHSSTVHAGISGILGETSGDTHPYRNPFPGNIRNTMDSSLRTALPLGDLQLRNGTNIITATSTAYAWGSITEKTPFLYVFNNTLWTNLDEIVIDGTTYTLLKFTNCGTQEFTGSSILLKQA